MVIDPSVIQTQNAFSKLTVENVIIPGVNASEEIGSEKVTTVIPKIKPISVQRTEDWKDLIKNIGEKIEKKFTAKPSNEFIRIFPEDNEGHRKISQFLKDQNRRCIIFEPGLVRPLKVVIRGLPIDTPINEIHEALVAQNLTPTKVIQLTSRKISNKGNPLPLFQIQLPNTEVNKTILRLKSIDYIAVKVEEYRAPRKIMQCFRCQHFHHTQNECFMDARCVKCTGPHQTLECPLGKGTLIDQTQLKCCNCGEIGHPASYGGCKKFPKTREEKERLKAREVTPEISYASLARATSDTPNTQNYRQMENENQPQAPKPNQGVKQSILDLTGVAQKISNQIPENYINKLFNIFNSALTEMENLPRIEDKLLVLAKSILQIGFTNSE